MSDVGALREILIAARIPFKHKNKPCEPGQVIRVRRGFPGYFTEFEFDHNGTLLDMGAWDESDMGAWEDDK